MAHAHLERAREYLAIAESDNPKREAYVKAADAIAAHKVETNDSNKNVATFLGISVDRVQKLLQWRKSGYKADTPYLMDDQATTRAAISHAKRVLREHPEEIAREIAQAVVTNDEVGLQVRYAEVQRAENNESARRQRELELKPGAPADEMERRSFSDYVQQTSYSLARAVKLADVIVFDDAHIEGVERYINDWLQSIDRLRMAMSARHLTDEDIHKALGDTA
jgi:hypothetical protein